MINKPVNAVPTVSQLKVIGEAWDKRFVYGSIAVVVIAVGFLAFAAVKFASPARADSVTSPRSSNQADAINLDGAPDVGPLDDSMPSLGAVGPATITGIPVEDSPVVSLPTDMSDVIESPVELAETVAEPDSSESQTAAVVAPTPSRVRRPDFTTDVYHKVESKDTLYHIALFYYGPEGVVRIKDIIAANEKISGSRDLKAGMTIRIPKVPEFGADVSLEPDAVESQKSQTTASAPDAVKQPDAKPAASGRVHIVKAGETLSGIARQHYGSAKQWKKIFDANADALKSPDAIRAGQTLVIPE